MATQAQQRSEPVSAAQLKQVTPMGVGEERFTIAALALKGNGKTPLDDYLTTLTVEDQGSELQGTLALTDPKGLLRLTAGQRVMAEWASNESAAFKDWWTLRAEAPEVQIPGTTYSVPLNSGLAQANKGTDNYSFKKSRSHPHGWTADEVARSVAARTHIPLGKLARCTFRITNLVAHSSKPLDAIVRAYQAERRATGRLFFIYWDGRLNVVPLTPSKSLIQFAGLIISAAYKEALRTDFATALTVRATTKGKQRVTKKGHKTTVKRTSHKIVVKVQSAAGIRKYGYVHREVSAPDAHTAAEARAYGNRLLGKVIDPEKTLTVTVPIMPGLRRGDAFAVNWVEQGLTQVCYVAGLNHSVSPGSATTVITAAFTSPFQDAKKQSDAEARERKAKAKGSPAASTGGTAAPSSAQAKRRG